MHIAARQGDANQGDMQKTIQHLLDSVKSKFQSLGVKNLLMIKNKKEETAIDVADSKGNKKLVTFLDEALKDAIEAVIEEKSRKRKVEDDGEPRIGKKAAVAGPTSEEIAAAEFLRNYNQSEIALSTEEEEMWMDEGQAVGEEGAVALSNLGALFTRQDEEAVGRVRVHFTYCFSHLKKTLFQLTSSYPDDSRFRFHW